MEKNETTTSILAVRMQRKEWNIETMATKDDVEKRAAFEFRRAVNARESGVITPEMLNYLRRKIVRGTKIS